MKIKQHQFLNNGWNTEESDLDPVKCQLVLAFGGGSVITKPEAYEQIRHWYPNARIIFSSTAGEIYKGNVYDDSISVTAIQLEKTPIRCVETKIADHADSFNAGKYLYGQLRQHDLTAIFVLTDGLKVNGDDLVEGLKADNSKKLVITGGLAGDGPNFQHTYTGMDAIPAEGNIIAVGFYGPHIKVGHGSMGGWEEFGFERKITKSDKNVLSELDNKSALDTYKKYLGEYVNELPGSALLFPLSMKVPDSDRPVIRTVLAVNEQSQSMVFAGNLPEGNTVKLMRANFDSLIDASATAATDSLINLENQSPDLTLMISCVGRKIILDTRTWEEVRNSQEVFGSANKVAGFYSYGGICPMGVGKQCELHNQTMTITNFLEI